MPDPAFVPVAAASVVLVASNVTTGQIHKVKSGSNGSEWFQTYRLTGGAAPTGFTDFGVKAFVKDPTEIISANAAIDIYLWLTGTEAGSVRVDV
jgi:hypothetical protein